MKAVNTRAILAISMTWVLAACSGEEGARGSNGAAGRSGSSGQRGGGDGGPSSQAGFGAVPTLPLAGEGAVDGDDAGGPACARQSAKAELQPVYLVFAFDVSGSMGKGDKPWHDRSLKWDPVVAATKAFLEDPSSHGLSASMTFFPADGGEDARCEVASYQEPSVAMRELPSDEFGRALDVIGMGEWRGGTPTLYVLQGVLDQIARAEQGKPGRYAIVLVTDGYPQDCDEDSIEAVAELARSHAAMIPTYVIGVSNPPIDDAPDVTTNLADIASAGGTDKAYLIDTGDPAQTSADFTATIESIRGASVSCNLAIPPPPAGETFDKTKVSVTYQSAGQSRALPYDAACGGGSQWHYDDPDQPQQIVLCPDACRALQADPTTELNVAFECERVILGPL
jgi:von Willebrand factor type A domain